MFYVKQAIECCMDFHASHTARKKHRILEACLMQNSFSLLSGHLIEIFTTKNQLTERNIKNIPRFTVNMLLKHCTKKIEAKCTDGGVRVWVTKELSRGLIPFVFK